MYFLYCQKLVVFSKDCSSVLLARRKGEEDYDGVYSFIGGKMDDRDSDFLEGMKREKNEEIGEDAQIEVLPSTSYNVLFTKNNGDRMVLPHIICIYQSGDIKLNEEYSDFKWVKVAELSDFKHKIETISEVVDWALKVLNSELYKNDFVPL